MIISRTPFRLSLFGGGTDFPEYFNYLKGFVVGMALKQYCYISLRRLPPFFEYNLRFSYSRIETAESLDQVEHSAIRAVLNRLGMTRGYEMLHSADLPARTGIGSSSSFVVGLLNSGFALQNVYRTSRELASLANHIERDVLQEAGGWQDAYWAVYGGMNSIDFEKGKVDVRPVPITSEQKLELCSHLMLFYTGETRTASEVTKSYEMSVEVLTEIQSIAHEAYEAICKGNWLQMGGLLHKSWRLKKRLSNKISTSKIDSLYEVAMKSGAAGGKIIGAGGGGFFLLVAEPAFHNNIREKLRVAHGKPLTEIPVAIDEEGTKILYREHYS